MCSGKSAIAAFRITRMRTIATAKLLCGFWLLALLALRQAAGAETIDQLSEKARQEKSLVIYAGGPVTNYEPLAREFEAKFPGISVSISGGFSNVLTSGSSGILSSTNPNLRHERRPGRRSAQAVEGYVGPIRNTGGVR
jgi:hypothetical protein